MKIKELWDESDLNKALFVLACLVCPLLVVFLVLGLLWNEDFYK